MSVAPSTCIVRFHCSYMLHALKFNFIFVRMELSKLSCINVTYVTGYNSVSVVNKMYVLNFMGVTNHEL